MPKTGSFASRELKKHGWNDGQGLGKLQTGMKEAIKVKVKNNTSGLGHDHGTEFTFHWWDHVFNKTANSIKVTSDEDGVKIEKDKDCEKIKPVLISNKKPLKSCFAGKPLLYGTFVKSGTFNASDGVPSNEEESESSSDEEDMSAKDTLEKTYKLTGLTGHKAARHGHKLSGKLKRIQEQEKNDDLISKDSPRIVALREPGSGKIGNETKKHSKKRKTTDEGENDLEHSVKKLKKRKKKGKIEEYKDGKDEMIVKRKKKKKQKDSGIK